MIFDLFPLPRERGQKILCHCMPHSYEQLTPKIWLDFAKWFRRKRDGQTEGPNTAQGGWAKNCAVAHPYHVSNSYTKFGWILPNALGDSMTVGRAGRLQYPQRFFKKREDKNRHGIGEKVAIFG